MLAFRENARWSRWARTVGANKPFALAASVALVLLIGIADHLTGYEIRLSILYLMPLAWSTWWLGSGAGAAIAIAATAFWLLTFASSHPYTKAVYFVLEGAIMAATFIIIAALLDQLHRALRRSDARLFTVLEGLDAAVHVADAGTGAELYANRRYRELFGDRLIGDVGGEIQDTMTGAWYLLQSRALRWTDGRAAVLRMLSDVTEERHARDLIARQKEAAHKISRLVALGEFASAVAHEINQPLTAIATYNSACLRLLDSGHLDVPELQQTMRKCRDQARRAGAIIQRLREVLRQPGPSRADVDLGEVAEAVEKLASSDAAEWGVTLTVRRTHALPLVRADRLLVEQVTMNLVRNAIEAVQHLAPERRRVAVSTSTNGAGTVTLAVSDAGEGVPPKVERQLFQPFVTTKRGGLGLGLSICRSVIESLDGKLEYRALEKQGAEFSFSLPVADRP